MQDHASSVAYQVEISSLRGLQKGQGYWSDQSSTTLDIDYAGEDEASKKLLFLEGAPNEPIQ